MAYLSLIKQQFFDASGDPLSGGKVYTYEAGTTTPKDSYTTKAGTVANDNPVILDSRGEANIWFIGNYKVVLKTAADATIYTVDNVAGTSADDIWTAISVASAKATPVDADKFGYYNSVGVGLVAATWANIKTTLLADLKDISGKFVGMTLYKINFKNAANTFTSFFTNSNTAARTYTFQDKSGSIAHLDDVTVASTKLPSISVTQATGALTIAATSQYFDFRSTTLTSGAPTTVLAAPAALVIPDGATLGSTTTVAADIVVLMINNAGTAELAVTNLSGGVDLSESGVISTTAIGTGSDSAGVVYSTTARTNVAYKVVKRFTAVNTAGSWGDPSKVGDIVGVRMLRTQPVTLSDVTTDITGMPSWAQEIICEITGLVSSGASISPYLQIGDAGGIETTGYDSRRANIEGTNATSIGTLTSGFYLHYSATVNVAHKGYIKLRKISDLTWASESALYNAGGPCQFQVGDKTLSGTLTQLRFLTGSASGFTGGTVSLLIKGY